MDSRGMFTGQIDYELPLLRILSDMPGGKGSVDEVCERFEEVYRSQIPAKHHEKYDREPKWRNNVRWCRKSLVGRGFLDASVHGAWRITESGRRWLAENPRADRIPGWNAPPPGYEVPQTVVGKPKRHTEAPSKRKPGPGRPAQGITLAMLEETRKQMAPEQFRQIWGPIYDQLLAEKRARSLSDIAQDELGRRTRKWLDEIHDVLRGKASAPASDVVCDWIQFCYRLDLCREVVALLPFVHEAEVNPASYARAKRVAEVCRGRLNC